MISPQESDNHENFFKPGQSEAAVAGKQPRAHIWGFCFGPATRWSSRFHPDFKAFSLTPG
jgi:hypothetical protein